MQKTFFKKFKRGFDADILEKKLNDLGNQGWKLNEVSFFFSNEGGPIFRRINGYYADNFIFLMDKTESKRNYCCKYFKEVGRIQKTIERINEETEGQNAKGYQLRKILHLCVIPSDPKSYRLQGTAGHVAIYEKLNLE